MRKAERINRLGTETAFAVSREAAEFAATGKKVFPFHLGDLNFPTPRKIINASLKALNEGKTGYSPNAGIPELRKALAENLNISHKTSYTGDNVVIQPGGKPVIGKFILALMNPGDGVLYPSPGYPIYESQIEFHGGVPVPYSYREGKNGFELDISSIERRITGNTRLLIFNDFQNPMAAEASPEELRRIAELVEKHDLYVLCDEAYFDVRYSGSSTSLASIGGMQERCVLLYTFSKKFAMTGWRLGAAAAPADIAEIIAKLNTNDESCPNHFIQYGALAGLREEQPEVGEMLEVLKRRKDTAVEILNSIEGVRCFNPDTTFYLFPNVTGAMERLGIDSYDDFRRNALHETGVSFCTRLHFGRQLEGEKEKHIRFAYSGIDADDLEEGLLRLKKFIET